MVTKIFPAAYVDGVRDVSHAGTLSSAGTSSSVNARQREGAKESRFAACASLLSSQPPADRCQSAGLFAYSLRVHR
jgi:hypothetical protein